MMIEKQLIIIPTLSCSQTCEHCTQRHRLNQTTMSLETFEKICVFAQDTLATKNIRIYWIGGEPLQVPQSWYDSAYSILDSYKLMTSAKLQTSLLDYDSSRADFVHNRLDHRLFTSYDPFFRKLNNSSAEYITKWKTKCSLAKDDGIQLCAQVTVSREWLDLSTSDAISLLEASSIPEISFCHYTTNNFSKLVRNCEYSQFLIRITDALLKSRTLARRLKIRTIYDAYRSLSLRIDFGAWQSPSCIFGSSFAITPNGEVWNCLLYEKSLGNLLNSAIELSSVSFQTCGKKYLQQKSKCRECKFSDWCSPRCYRNPYPADDDTDECQRYPGFLTYLKSRIDDPVLIEYCSKFESK